MVKSFLLSKTIWFGIAQVAFGVVGYFTGWIDSTTATSLVITGCGTIGIRFNTSRPISLTGY